MNLKIGLQLYSVRDAMEKDMDATLRAVKEMGYDYVEFAGYFGKSADEVKAILDKYELTAISVHQAIWLFWEKGQEAVDYLKDIGVKYCAIPWYDANDHINNHEETIEKFTALGKTLKDNGIQLLYHNHDFELKKVKGKIILDTLYEEIPSDILQPQFDVCWVHYAGYDPAEYIKKYSGRIDVVHFKDFDCKELGGGPAYDLIDEDGNPMGVKSHDDNGFAFKPVGYGRQNWKAIIDATVEAGAQYAIVEQDSWYDGDSLECARMSRKYLKEKFGI